MQATKTYAVNFTATAKGDGYWGMQAGQQVTFSSISVSVCDYADDGELCATLNAEHDADAELYGLCYTDSGVEDALNEFIAQHAELCKLIESADGSEQGMQDDTTLNCDVALRDSVDAEQLAALGYEIDEE